MSTRFLLADDHSEFRDGLRRMIESIEGYEVVAEASTVEAAIELGRRHRPEVALLDVRMKQANGIGAIDALLQHSPRTAIVIVSMHADWRYVRKSIRAGARGYLLKESLDEWFARAMRTVLEGELFLEPSLVTRLKSELQRSASS